jgi:hypothetical protein
MCGGSASLIAHTKAEPESGLRLIFATRHTFHLLFMIRYVMFKS